MPLLFIAIPLIELYFIIVVGEAIGALWTVILVILTAVIGVNLLRFQGMSTLTRAQRNMAQGQIPAMEMMEGVALAVAGILLITPGFITDTLGFLCLFPPTRQAIIRYLLLKSRLYMNVGGRSASWHSGQPGQAGQHQEPGQDTEKAGKPRVGRTIDGEYHRED